MAIEFALPFRINGGGGVATTSDPDVQIANHVRALVGTQPGVRPMRPDYGMDTASLLFDGDDELTRSLLQARAEAAFAKFEPGVALTAVGINPADDDGVQGLRLEYRRRSDADSGAGQKTNVAIVEVGGRVTETVRG